MSDDHVCHICGTAGMERDSAPAEFEYKGQTLAATVHFHFCNACGAEFGFAVDQRDTARAQNRARKAHDGLLLGEEIKAIRTRLRLKQDTAQALFGGGPVSFSKYEHDEVLHSKLLDVTLRLMGKDESYLDAYAREAGVALPYRKVARFVRNVAKSYEVRSVDVEILGGAVRLFDPAGRVDLETMTMDDWAESGRAPRSLLAAQYAYGGR